MTNIPQQNNVIIGKHSYYNGNIKLVSSEYSKIYIGNYCSIGNNLKIITLNHDYNYPALLGRFYRKFFNESHPGETNIPPTQQRTKGDVIIGNDVWIGDDVTILSGVTIGDGCCIGAKSLITHNMPAYSICAGIPCKKVKNRYSDNIIDILLKLKWWNWDDEKIIKNKKFFYTNLNLIEPNELMKIII